MKYKWKEIRGKINAYWVWAHSGAEMQSWIQTGFIFPEITFYSTVSEGLSLYGMRSDSIWYKQRQYIRVEVFFFLVFYLRQLKILKQL